MRRSKELILLVVLLLGTVAFILWYVVDRRARQGDAPPAAASEVGPVTLDQPPGIPIDLEKFDGKTIDLSTGKAVIKDSPEDRAAMEAALKEMDEAMKNVTFEAPKTSEPKK